MSLSFTCAAAWICLTSETWSLHVGVTRHCWYWGYGSFSVDNGRIRMLGFGPVFLATWLSERTVNQSREG